MVCIHKGHIYDGTFRKYMKLSKQAMVWLAKDETFHLKCFALEPSKKLKRALADTTENNERSTEYPVTATKRRKH